MEGTIAPEGGFRTNLEREVEKGLADAFRRSSDDLTVKLDEFPKYVRRQRITRLLALYEIFKRVLPVKGSVIECGVYRGFGLMAWAHFSAILEPVNLTRRIYGFDTFGGFPGPSEADTAASFRPEEGTLFADSFEELKDLVKLHDQTRYLGHLDKVHLIRGDATQTIPQFVQENNHLVVSLLFLDFDLFEPTKVAIECLYPRMPKGAVIAFDELDNPLWPGETQALLKTLGIGSLKLERLDFDPYIGYGVID